MKITHQGQTVSVETEGELFSHISRVNAEPEEPTPATTDGSESASDPLPAQAAESSGDVHTLS